MLYEQSQSMLFAVMKILFFGNEILLLSHFLSKAFAAKPTEVQNINP